MSYKRNKDRIGLISQMKITSDHMKPYYFHAYLWDTKEDMRRNAPSDIDDKDWIATTLMCERRIVFKPDGEEEIIPKKLGELHFVKGRWDLEIITHELCHMLIQRIRMIGPDPDDILNQIEDNEENICYEFGSIALKLYGELWRLCGYGEKGE